MTVEASIVLPLILFFFMNLASSIEMIRLHGNLQLALWETGNELIVYGYALDSGTLPDEAQGGEIQIDREQVDGIQFEGSSLIKFRRKNGGKDCRERSFRQSL